MRDESTRVAPGLAEARARNNNGADPQAPKIFGRNFRSFTIAGPTTIESPCRSRRPSLFSVGVGNLPAAVGDSQNFIDYGSMVTLPISRRKSVLKEFTHRGRPPHSVGMGNFEMARAVVSPAAAGAAQLVAEYLAVARMDLVARLAQR
jgi:hypothetical protein